MHINQSIYPNLKYPSFPNVEISPLKEEMNAEVCCLLSENKDKLRGKLIFGPY